MTIREELKLTTGGERKIVMTREVNAPGRIVFDAFTKPDLVKRWLLGPPGWSMPICNIDLRVGGTYRYVWLSTDGGQLGMSGVYQEIAAPEQLVATERLDEAWYSGEAPSTVVLFGHDGTTWVTQTVLYQSHTVRGAVLKSAMAKGVAASYDRLAELLIAPPTHGMEKGVGES